jgi:hypothetical protein
MQDVPALLSDRNKTHGNFNDNAAISQAIKEVFQRSPAWQELPPVHRESLDQIALKLSRVLSGHSLYSDHWLDIAGYAKLAAEICDDAAA